MNEAPSTLVLAGRGSGARYVHLLGVTVKIACSPVTGRYEARVAELDRPLAGMAVGAVIAEGGRPSAAKERALHKIAARRRPAGAPAGPFSSVGVTVIVRENTGREIIGWRRHEAVVVSVEDSSPLAQTVHPGQSLATHRQMTACCDRALVVLSRLADQALDDDTLRTKVAEVGRPQLDDWSLWRLFSACKMDGPTGSDKVDVEFFPERSNSVTYEAPQRVCRRCPVQAACLAEALDKREGYGVWGGKTPLQRRGMLRLGITGDMVRAENGIPQLYRWL